MCLQYQMNRDYVISIVYSPEKYKKYQKIGKSWHGGNKPIASQMGKLDLSVQFRQAGTSQFFDIFLNFSGL